MSRGPGWCALLQLNAYGACDHWLHVNQGPGLPYNWQSAAEHYQICQPDGRGEGGDPESGKDIHNIGSYFAVEPWKHEYMRKHNKAGSILECKALIKGDWSDRQCNILDHLCEADRPGADVTKPLNVRDLSRALKLKNGTEHDLSRLAFQYDSGLGDYTYHKDYNVDHWPASSLAREVLYDARRANLIPDIESMVQLR